MDGSVRLPLVISDDRTALALALAQRFVPGEVHNEDDIWEITSDSIRTFGSSLRSLDLRALQHHSSRTLQPHLVTRLMVLSALTSLRDLRLGSFACDELWKMNCLLSLSLSFFSRVVLRSRFQETPCTREALVVL